MGKIVVFTFIGIVVVLTGVSSINVAYNGDIFSLEHPCTVSVQKNMIMDFDIYSFNFLGQKILGIYVGNHPEASPDNQGNVTAESGEQNGLPYKMYTTHESSGKNSREVYFTVPGALWPQYIHVWYSNLEPDTAKISDAIILSLRLAEEQEAIMYHW